MTNQSLRRWFWVHKWTSLLSTIFLFMLCVTGLPLIFYHEIDHALGNTVELPVLAGNESSIAVSLDNIVAAGKARLPGSVVQYAYPDEENYDAWWLTMADAADSPEALAHYMFDRRTGEFVHEYPMSTGFMTVLYRLHLDMYAGLSGTLFLGFMGLLLAASLVSGVVVYGPFMSKLKFGTVRRNKSSRIKWLDLHNLLGIATLVWVMVVGVTGVINTLTIPVFAYWQNTELASMTSGYKSDGGAEESSVQAALVTAENAIENANVSFIAFPGNQYASPYHYSFFMKGNTPLTSKLLTPVLVEAETSALTEVGDMPWYVTTLLLSQPLHFGDYGKLPLKIIWALLDIMAIIVLASGVYLWIKKRNIPINERIKAIVRKQSEQVGDLE